MELYRYHPPSITSQLRVEYEVKVVEYHIENQQNFLQLLKDNLVISQNKMKQQAYQHRNERNFEVAN